MKIKEYWSQGYSQAWAGDYATAMPLYMQQVRQQLGAKGSELPHVNEVSEALFGAAKMYSVAHSTRNPGARASPKPSVDAETRAFVQELLTLLQPLSAHAEAKNISNLFWAWAKLGIDPDSLVPGTVERFSQQLLPKLEGAHGQTYACVLLALDQLQINPLNGQLLQQTLRRINPATVNKWDGTLLAKVTYSLAKLMAFDPNTRVCDALCSAFRAQLIDSGTRKRPTAFSISTFSWAISKMRHAPAGSDQESPDLLSIMMTRMIGCCRQVASGPQKPSSQCISNFLLACAVLRHAVSQREADILVACLLSNDRNLVKDISASVWSLAAIGVLDAGFFEKLLDRLAELTTRQKLTEGTLSQMYLGLDRIKPDSTASETEQAQYQQWEAKMKQLGDRPKPSKPGYTHEQKLSNALSSLGLNFETSVLITDMHWVDAVIRSKDPAEPMLVLTQSHERFNNGPKRYAMVKHNHRRRWTEVFGGISLPLYAPTRVLKPK